MRVAARLLLLLACAAAVARAGGDEAAGSGEVTAGAGAAAAEAARDAPTPDWLKARSQRTWRINGDTWHRVAQPDEAASNKTTTAEAAQQHRRRFPRVFYYNEHTRETAWELPRHAPRGTPLWSARAADGSELPLGPPLLDLSALSFPDCARDWATIVLPAALFIAARHARPWAAAAQRALADSKATLLLGGRTCAAPKAD